MKYAALIPCGPGAVEGERVMDQLDALQTLDPRDCVAAAVMVDRNETVGAWPSTDFRRVFANPSLGKGWGWAGGLIAGELWAFDWLLRDFPEIGCVVKLDADALPIKPLGDALGRIFENPRAGFAGERTGYDPFAGNPDPSPRRDRQRMIRKLRAPLSLWRMPRWHPRQSIFGRHRWVASLYDEAERHGYQPGDVLEGGVCAFSRICLERVRDYGVLARWRDFIDIAVADDLILSMLPYLVGLEAVSEPLFSPGEHRGLKFAPEALLEHPRVGLVHSVKRYNDLDEQTIRAFFRRARRP